MRWMKHEFFPFNVSSSFLLLKMFAMEINQLMNPKYCQSILCLPFAFRITCNLISSQAIDYDLFTSYLFPFRNIYELHFGLLFYLPIPLFESANSMKE